MNLKQILTALGWSLGLVAVFSAILALFGVDLVVVESIAVTMIGASALFSALVEVGKWTGLVTDGTAGYWSVGLNLAGLAGIAIVLYFLPNFDFAAIDVQFQTLAQFIMLIVGYGVQIAGSKLAHRVTSGFGLKVISPVG